MTFNPFTWEAGLGGLRIAGAGDNPVAGFSTASANFNPLASLLSGAWQFGEVILDAPHARFVIDEQGTLNIHDMVSRIHDRDQSEVGVDRGSEGGVQLRVESISVRNGLFELEDRSHPEPFSTTIRPVELTLANLATTADAQGRYTLSGRTQRQESFTWTGTLSIAPFESSGRFAFEDVQLPAYQPFIAPLFGGQLRDGRGDLTTDYTVSLSADRTALLSDLVLRFTGLQLALPLDDTPIAELPLATFRAARIDLFGRSGELERVNLERPVIRITRLPDGALDVARLFTPPRGDTHETTPPAAAENTPPRPAITLGEITLSEGTLHLIDHSTRQQPVMLHLDQLAFRIDGGGRQPTESLPLHLEARWQGGPGTFTASGSVRPVPMHLDVQLTGSELTLAALDGYVRSMTGAILESGTLSTEGHLALALPEKQTAQVTWTGDLTIRDLAIRDAALDAPLFGWQEFQVDGLAISHAPLRLSASDAALYRPELHVVRTEDATINVVSALSAAKEDQDATAAETPTTSAGKQRLENPDDRGAVDPSTGGSKERPQISLETLTITDGIVSFQDRLTEPTVEARVTALEGTVSEVSSAHGSPARIQLTGTIEDSATLSIEGTANLVAQNPPVPSNLAVNLQSLPLEILEPYAARLLGYRIDSGRLGADLAYSVASESLQGSNRVVLKNFTLGDRVPEHDTLDFPLQLALSVLRDRDGEIELQLPVSGELGSVHFDIASATADAIRGVLSRAASAPFAMLGSLFGTSGEELQHVSFPPGSAQPGSDEGKGLQALAEILSERPGLDIRILATPPSAVDTEALRSARLEQLLEERSSADHSPHPQDALRSLYAARFPSQATSESPHTAAGGEQDPPRRPILSRFWRWLTGSNVDGADAETRTADADIEAPRTFPPAEEMRRQLLPTITVDEAFTGLAASRAEHAKQALIDAGIDPDRITVAQEPSPPEGSPRGADTPQVIFELVPRGTAWSVSTSP